MLLFRFSTILIGFIVFFTPNIFAENYSISGVVQEDKTQHPIAYATVAIYNEIDSTLIAGIITNEEGRFKIDITKTGNYYIKINVLFEKLAKWMPYCDLEWCTFLDISLKTFQRYKMEKRILVEK